MAKVIKLKDRSGSLVLPLTRSQLVQVTQITGLDLLNEKSWSKASVQDALDALMSYATTISESNAGALKDIQTIKSALEGVLTTQKAVVNYVDSHDTAYLALAYAEAKSKADTAEQNAKNYADSNFVKKVDDYSLMSSAEHTKLSGIETGAEVNIIEGIKLNNSTLTPDANRVIDLGSIATSAGMEELSNKVNAIESSYVSADTAIVTGYTTADNAIITSYTAADSAIIAAYTAADTALSGRIDNLETNLAVTVTEVNGSGDILKGYTIKQGTTTLGTINIPKDMVATSGELVHGSLSGSTFTANNDGDPYIKMTVGNGNSSDTFYIPVAELIEYNSVQSNSEITLTDTGHVIEATVGSISSSKITFTPAGDNPTDTTVQAALRDLYSQIGAGGSVSSQIQTAINALDADLDATGTAAHNGTFVVSGVTEVNGVITSVDSVEVEAAGAAAAVKTELLGNADTNNNTLGKLASRIDTLNGAAVKKVNNQTPNATGEVTVNASQINTVNTYKIGNDASATTHTVDEVLAEGVFYEQVGSRTVDDVTLDSFE